MNEDKPIHIPSRVRSWLWARKATKNWSVIPIRNTGKIIPRQRYLEMLKDTDVCPICKENSGWVLDPEQDEVLDCICRTMHYEFEQYYPVIERYGSSYRKGMTLEAMNIHHLTPKPKKVLHGVIEAFKIWRYSCHTWVMMYGDPGCGKSHILEALADELFPMALYLSAEEFNTSIRNAVGSKTLDELIDMIKNIPVLLFDDWGTGYDSDFTQSTMRAIMQHRYNHAIERPTIITTNKNEDTIYKTDPRLADRMFEVAKWIDMTSIPSYRQVRKLTREI